MAFCRSSRMPVYGLVAAVVGFGLLALATSCAPAATPPYGEATPTPTATPNPVPTDTPAPTKLLAPALTPPLVVTDEPNSFCQDGRMVAYDRPKEKNGTPTMPLHHAYWGWRLVADPQPPLPAAPGDQVRVRSWWFGLDYSTGEFLLGSDWGGSTIRVYVVPVPLDLPYPGFYPWNGTDRALEGCLEQAAYFLGEGPVSPEGYLDFLLRVPEAATLSGEPYSLLDVAALGKLKLFAVTDAGTFAVGGDEQVIVPPYRLAATPASVDFGDTVVIEGSGLPQEGETLVAVTNLPVTPDGGGGTGVQVEMGRAVVQGGHIRIEWTVPERVTVPNWPPFFVPTPTPEMWPTPTPLPPGATPQSPTNTPGPVTGTVTSGKILPIGIYRASGAGRDGQELYSLSLFLGLEDRTKAAMP